MKAYQVTYLFHGAVHHAIVIAESWSVAETKLLKQLEEWYPGATVTVNGITLLAVHNRHVKTTNLLVP